MTRLRLGTRRSALATTQSGWVADQLRALGHEVELVEITTFGDTSTQPLSAIGGTGVFAAAIRQALLAGEVDLAVHSLKDLPVAPEPGLTVAAVTRREDPRDALVARDGLTLGELPAGAVVGTGSPRRAAQIAALGLGLDVRAIRGNVDTRLRLVHDGKVDAVVLAAAGLARLGRLDEVTELIDPLQMLPAPGQGALAEVVEGMDGAELSVRAFVGSEDGAAELRRSVTGPVPEAERLGRELAAVLLEDGARDIVTVGLGPTVSEDRPPDPGRAGGHDPQHVADRPHDPADRPDPTAPERAL
jgi:hydroxymethylbilane synthase